MANTIDLLADDTDNVPYVTGEVKKIIFENKSDFFIIMAVEIEDTNIDYDEDEIVIKGTFGEIKETMSYTFYGKLTNHSKFGMQFNCTSYEKDLPDTEESLIDYLSSSRFKGIGKVTAKNIIDKLGSNAITEIINNPDELDDIQGMNATKKANMVEVLNDSIGLETIFLQLNKYGISNQLAARIYDQYGVNAFHKIQENPYILSRDFAQISFKKADLIAEQFGFEPDSTFRLEAGLIYVLATHCGKTGDTYMEEGLLLQETTDLLEASNRFMIEIKDLQAALVRAVDNGGVIAEENRYYMRGLHQAEKNIAFTINYLLNHYDEESYDYSEDDLDEAMEKVQDTYAMAYGESQIEAIYKALVNPVFILTGGPGTGKTTVVNAIVNMYATLNDKPVDPHAYKDGDDYPFVLAAPTGRAAKRMTETTGIKSRTLHSLLGLKPGDEASNSANDTVLSGEILIVDEMSMVDTWLLSKLLDAVPEGMQVILIGDKDQLPSVGPGQAYSDLIASRQVPAVELTEIYRQDADSTISFLARDIKNGYLPADFTEKKPDRSFFKANPNQVLASIDQIIQIAIDSGYTAHDIQVLAPMYKGQAGINALNQVLQNLFNPNEDNTRKEVKHFDNIFRISDKVLQLENDPENGVFNGDIGVITGIEKGSTNSADKLIVTFDQIEVEYPRTDWNKITLAYCMSIHKAQGSEFKSVVLPYTSDYYYMLRKDLLYTAITRASDSLILIGEVNAFEVSLSRTSGNRKTTLIKRLVNNNEDAPLVENEPVAEGVYETEVSEIEEENETVETSGSYILTSTAIKHGKIDPMIGMEDITLKGVSKNN